MFKMAGWCELSTGDRLKISVLALVLLLMTSQGGYVEFLIAVQLDSKMAKANSTRPYGLCQKWHSVTSVTLC